jgi:uncharacterized repeat protein (TIGR03943 family)
MTVRIRSTTSSRVPSSGKAFWLVWLDVAAIFAWGVLLLRYWLTGKINILLHPDYIWLAISAGVFLIGLGSLKVLQILRQTSKRRSTRPRPSTLQHTTLFPPSLSSGLLLAVAIVGLQFTPQPFTSQVALQRGVTDTLVMTRSQPQSFRGNVRPEDRSIIDWVRTLSVYPEPDAYKGQQAKVEGFTIHPPELSDNYLTISRFVITCCAADVYPVGLPVKLSQSRSAYPADRWFRVEGEMITETLNGQRQLVIQATSLIEIPEPKNPYDY